MQLVNLVEGGERARMSKRRGEFATLDELVDDIGVDAARFFLVQRSHDTAIDIDLDLARTQSSDNPVYYVQYAHARICTIFRAVGERGAGGRGLRGAGGDARARRAGADRAPARAARRRSRAAASRREPHGIAAYVARGRRRLPRLLPRLPRRRTPARGSRARAWSSAARPATSSPRCLDLLGIEAPEEM